MLVFDPISVGRNTYQLNEVSFMEAIKVAGIKRPLNERRITQFLKLALKDQYLPLTMTAEERYYLAIKYSLAHDNSLDYGNYLLPPGKPFLKEVTHQNIRVRSLTGRDAELLESKCENIADWLLGVMSLQMEPLDRDIPKLPDLDCSNQELENALINRSTIIRALPDSEIDAYFNRFTEAMSQMESLVSFGFDNDGLTLLGGTDDAPLRFRPTVCLSELSRRLEQYLADQGAAVE